jgi:hypothetical protein
MWRGMMIRHATLTMLATALLGAAGASAEETESFELVAMRPLDLGQQFASLPSPLERLSFAGTQPEVPAAPSGDAEPVRPAAEHALPSVPSAAAALPRPSLYIENGLVHFVTTAPRIQP